MQVEITNNYCKLRVKEGDICKEKMVNLSDLLDELSVYRATNFGLLPKDVRIIESMGNSMVVGLEFPKRTWRVHYEPAGTVAKIFENVSLPGGLCLVHTSKDTNGELKHMNTFIFAIRGKRVMFHSDRLYQYPTPNVYGTGKVCWGNIRVAPMKHLSATEGVLNAFFTNKFNNDLFGSRYLTDSFSGPAGTRDHPEFYFDYLNKNEFQDQWLVETPHTVSQIASAILRNNIR